METPIELWLYVSLFSAFFISVKFYIQRQERKLPLLSLSIERPSHCDEWMDVPRPFSLLVYYVRKIPVHDHGQESEEEGRSFLVFS
jgi:hypothetical protein